MGLRAGELLAQAKHHPNMSHGRWLSWLKANVEFNRQTADNYRRLYENRDKFAKFANLALSDAYALLMDKQRKCSERTAREKRNTRPTVKSKPNKRRLWLTNTTT
jgi:hypothetical protein